MNSKSGKKFSLDEMTDMYKPNEEETQNEIPMVLLTEEEWTRSDPLRLRLAFSTEHTVAVFSPEVRLRL